MRSVEMLKEMEREAQVVLGLTACLSLPATALKSVRSIYFIKEKP
jgi:hypothetical protein